MSGHSEEIGAIVLAAGRSTRFRSARSKLVHELGGRAIIRWVLGVLREAEIAPIVVVVGPTADDVRAACGDGVSFAVQPEPRGTGAATLAAESALQNFDGNVLLLYGDLPRLRSGTLRRLIDAARASRAPVGLLTATIDDPHGWGRIVRHNGGVVRIVEERDATPEQRAIREVNVGVYCVHAPTLFSLLHSVKPDNAQGEIYLTDIVAGARAAGLPVADVAVDLAEVGQINARGELAGMEKALRTEINAHWMASGITLEDPDTTYIGPDVTIGQDTVIGPNVHLRGTTRIGANCRIDGSAFITDAVIGDGTILLFGVVITESEVGPQCRIGPFANLRAKTRLGDGVHIGDFVETKNAVLGGGVKANHLAYLGDAEIGRETNVGAGTITCNYDGFQKHRTVIGERVQVGSDTTLVAPVHVGDDAYIATATTVRTDVPPGALAFNPREQGERLGWVAGFRARKTGAPGPPAAKPAARRKAKAVKKAVSRTRARSKRSR